jgi:large subunit ribosomal protein L6
MSRVGKNEVVIPSSVTFAQDGNSLSFKGKLGASVYEVPDCVTIEKTNTGIKFLPINDSLPVRTLWGTTQRNVANMVKGLDQGFTVNLELNGVGYRASVAGTKLTMQLGYSHDIVYEIPSDISIKCDKPTSISVSGASKQKVGQIAAVLRSYRKPEPYKGKGVIRQNEFVVRKEGKKK